jgi:HAD superfamily 5'-nucleotidase-like hydrolase
MTTEPTFTPLAKELLSLIEADGEERLHPAEAVYTNRDLDLSQIKLVGFDMDYTLAIYKKQPMEQLQYDLTVERIIQRAGYPEEIRQLTYDPAFIARGLILDKRNGHLIKMDTHGRVGRVFHGRRRLPPEEIKETYRNAKIRLVSEAKGSSFASVDTLFSMPEACLYANLVEYFEERHRDGKSTTPIALPHKSPAEGAVLLGNVNTWKLFDDVRTAIDDIHRDGTLKNIIMADLPTYFVVDEDLPLTLHKLRSAGKRLFLLTNSYWAFTENVMSYLLDGLDPEGTPRPGRLKEYASWRQYFDIVSVGARKPRFFTDRDPFLEVPPAEGQEQAVVESDRFDRGRVTQGGNIETFERMAQAQGEEILYVGDHIFGDILRSKKDSRWRTCLIVEELEDEIKGAITGDDMIDRLTRIDEKRHKLDDAIAQQRALLTQVERTLEEATEKSLAADLVRKLEESGKKLKKELDVAKRHLRGLDHQAQEIQDALDKHFNPWWGRLLKSNNELSRFGAQVDLYACTYTSKVSNFLRYSPVHLFRAPRELMSHDVALASNGARGVKR